jgi:hypothetical protein
MIEDISEEWDVDTDMHSNNPRIFPTMPTAFQKSE